MKVNPSSSGEGTPYSLDETSWNTPSSNCSNSLNLWALPVAMTTRERSVEAPFKLEFIGFTHEVRIDGQVEAKPVFFIHDDLA